MQKVNCKRKRNSRIIGFWKNEGFKKERPLIISKTLDEINFSIERRNSASRELHLELSGLEAGNYIISDTSGNIKNIAISQENKNLISFPFELDESRISIQKGS